MNSRKSRENLTSSSQAQQFTFKKGNSSPFFSVAVLKIRYSSLGSHCNEPYSLKMLFRSVRPLMDNSSK